MSTLNLLLSYLQRRPSRWCTLRPLLLWRLLHPVDEAKRTRPCFYWHLHIFTQSLVLASTTAWPPSVMPHMPCPAHEQHPRGAELLAPARYRQARRSTRHDGRRGLAAYRRPVPGTPAPSRVSRIPPPSPPRWLHCLCCISNHFLSLFQTMGRDVFGACGPPKHAMGPRESREPPELTARSVH